MKNFNGKIIDIAFEKKNDEGEFLPLKVCGNDLIHINHSLYFCKGRKPPQVHINVRQCGHGGAEMLHLYYRNRLD